MPSRIEVIKNEVVLVRVDPRLEPFSEQEFNQAVITVIGATKLQAAEYIWYYLACGGRQGTGPEDIQNDVIAIIRASSVRDYSAMNRRLRDEKILTGEFLKSDGQINMHFVKSGPTQDARVTRIMQGWAPSLAGDLPLERSDEYRKLVIEPLFGKAFIYRYSPKGNTGNRR